MEIIDYCALMRRIERLISQNTGNVALSFLGTTPCGRAIPILTLGNDKSCRAVLYVGAHHASEWLTSSVLLRFAEGFAKVNVPYAVVVIPMLNCDGVELAIHGGADFVHWQANARGVDLNHNYDAGFYEYKKIERALGITGCAPTRYAGEYPESEVEVGALCNYLRFQPWIKGALTLHTQGEVIYSGTPTPCGGKIGKALSKLTGYALEEPQGAAAYGGMTDWVTSALGIPCFTLECGKGENPLPPSDFEAIYKRVKPALFEYPKLILG